MGGAWTKRAPSSPGSCALDRIEKQKEPGALLLFLLSLSSSSLSSLEDVLGHGFRRICKEIMWERGPFPPCALGDLKSNSGSCSLGDSCVKRPNS